MKKITLSILIVCVLTMMNMISFAQKTVVTETNEHLGGTVNPSFSVFIENAEGKNVVKSWKTTFENHKGKVETSKNDVIIEDVIMSKVSTTPIAVFSRITEEKTGVKIISAYTKEGQYICTKYLPTETETIKNFIYDFAVKVKKEMVQKEIDEATKQLDKLKDNNNNLIDKKSGLEKDILSYNKKIKKAEDEIISNPNMLAEDKAKQDKDILNQKLKISEAEQNIKENETQQSEMKVKIESQTKVVDDLKAKYDAVD